MILSRLPSCTLAALAAILILTPMPASAEIVQSGSVTMETGDITAAPAGSTAALLSEYLVNPGFETGALVPWYTNASWAVVNTDAHSGIYSAYGIGNNWVRQDVAPIDTADINSVSFWCKQPEAGTQLQAFDLFYDDNTYDEDIWFPGDDWSQVDITYLMRPPGSVLVAIRIWGYSGGGPDPDETFIDDVSIDANVATPVTPATWGAIKAIF